MHKYKKIFVDKYEAFNEDDWSEVSQICKINHETKKEEKSIKITFNFRKLPSPEIIKKLFKGRKPDKAGIIEIIFKHTGFFLDEEKLRDILQGYIGIPIKFSCELSPPYLIFDAEDEKEREEIDKISSECTRLIWFLFNDKEMKISVNTKYNRRITEVIKEKKKQQPPKKFTEGRKEVFYLFQIEVKVDLAGNKRYHFGLTNWNSYYWFSLPKNNEDTNKDILPNLQENKYYLCKYRLNTGDRFSDTLDGFLIEIEETEYQGEEIGIDNSEKKIIPLCIHTKNSAFDGLYDVESFVKEASEKKKHHAIAITDYASVQGFSSLEKHSKKYGIKPIYGTEMELLEDDYPVVVNDTSLWDKQNYCIFDIETSGLYPAIDEIIEIAIFKYRGNRRVDSLHYYLKAKKPIKKHIETLTRINDRILEKEGRDPEEVLRETREFIRGSLLVAHNGINFDLPFLNAKLEDYGIEKITEPLLDSMRLSQAIFAKEKYKSHSLAAICKKAGIEYQEQKAHRADEDVKILWNVFSRYLEPELRNRNIFIEETLGDLNGILFDPEVFNYVHGNNVLIYAKNQKGIKSLYEIISHAHTDGFFGKTTISPNVLNKYKENLLIVSPLLNSDLLDLILKCDEEGFKKALDTYDYIILPSPSQITHEIKRGEYCFYEMEEILKKFYELCQEESKTCLLNSTIRYLYDRDYEKYSVLINTKGISGKRHYLYNARDWEKGNQDLFPRFFYKTTSEILEDYEFLGEKDFLLEKAFEAQEKFLSEIEDNLEVTKKTLHAPHIEGCFEKLKSECMSRMKNIYGKKPNKYILDKYETEIKAILENNYSVIYWVSHLLVAESIKNGYLVGSRGSVGSSFVAFLLNISEVNPLPPHYFCTKCSHFDLQEDFPESGFDLKEKKCPKCKKIMESNGHNIPFETFLGFEGNKIPDIDLNFSGEYQNNAHNFLKKYFGEDKVFRAGTISSMAEKTAFAIVKTYIDETNENRSPRIKYSHGKIKWLSNQIINVKRTSGQHPGGILVVPQEYSIHDFTPVNYPANDKEGDWLTTHFEFDDLHDALLKFDILGHDDPTTLALLKDLTGVDPTSIPHHDEKVLELYRSCTALGIEENSLVNEDNTGAIGLPEFGTLLTRKILQACKPKKFADLIRISGFSHGTGVWKNNIDKLITKEGHKLNEVITCRDDITLYLKSKGLSWKDSFSISEDIRKGKGISEENLELLKKHEVPDWYIDSAKKITYIFPKAHATAYVLMSWKIAWYKLNYPLAFYAVYFSTCHQDFDWNLLRSNNFDHIKSKYKSIQSRLKSWQDKKAVSNKEKSYLTVYEVALEFLKRGFSFADIDLNKSKFSSFVPLEDEKKILIPFIVIDGLGEVKAKTIEEERKNGEYLSLEDLIERTSINRTVINAFKEKRIIPQDWY